MINSFICNEYIFARIKMEDSIAPDKSKLEVGASADRFKMAPSTPKPKKSLLMKIRAEASMGK